MNLTLYQQALLLNYIYEAGWVNREGYYFEFIQNELAPEIEKNISVWMGRGWTIDQAVTCFRRMESGGS